MQHFLIVALGGAVGAGCRHLVNLYSLRFLGVHFPWGTLIVNVVGSFLMGVFIEILVRKLGASTELRLFIATGCLGGFTTFSAFSLDAVLLWERGQQLYAGGYVAASVLLSIFALVAGLAVMRTALG